VGAQTANSNTDTQTIKISEKSLSKNATPPAGSPTPHPEKIVGLPQDAGPHDLSASVEWWYFNTFCRSETGRNIASVGSFFRTGLAANRKGHYLIYALSDLDTKEHQAFSILDRQEINLLMATLPLVTQQRPDDPRPFRLLKLLQSGELPPPHRNLHANAMVQKRGLFSIAFDNNSLAQLSEDGRSWKVQLNGDDWALDLDLSQPERPPMLPGGKGYTGIKHPEDFYYLSLTRMKATGTLTSNDGVVEKFTGDGWLDRQWGSPDFITSYGWDWMGLQLDNGDDLILDRIRELGTGKIVKYRATLMTKEGKQIVEPNMELKPVGDFWRDPESHISFPSRFEVVLPEIGYKLTVSAMFPDQAIPVIGVGDAIWEGAVKVEGTTKEGGLVTGRGFMELVGYRK
jgi:predicted secreted hydrolase